MTCHLIQQLTYLCHCYKAMRKMEKDEKIKPKIGKLTDLMILYSMVKPHSNLRIVSAVFLGGYLNFSDCYGNIFFRLIRHQVQ